MKNIYISIIIILAVILITGCTSSIQSSKQIPEKKDSSLNWIFCSGYIPGPRGGVMPGEFEFYSYIKLNNKLFEVDKEFIKDTNPSDEGKNSFANLINVKIDNYMRITKIEITKNGIIVNNNEITNIVEKPISLSGGTIAGCIESQGKSIEEVKLFFSEKLTLFYIS